MGWWNDFVAWFNSADGARVIYGAIIPFVAIVVAGLVAAAIGRGSARRVLAHQDRELKGAAIQALIIVGRKAAIWSSLGADEKQHIDSLMSESDIRVRLLPVTGAGVAADWAAHELAAMKKNSAAFSFQAEQTFFDYRDRLLDWQLRPNRARKLFASDLSSWSYEDAEGDKALVAQQQEWATAHTEPPRTAATAVSLTGATPTGLTPTVATPTSATPTSATPTSSPPTNASPAETVPITTAATS
jgi:hypothetical protein